MLLFQEPLSPPELSQVVKLLCVHPVLATQPTSWATVSLFASCLWSLARLVAMLPPRCLVLGTQTWVDLRSPHTPVLGIVSPAPAVRSAEPGVTLPPPNSPDAPQEPVSRTGDDSEATTLRPTLPDLSPDEPEPSAVPVEEEEEEVQHPPGPPRLPAESTPDAGPGPTAEAAAPGDPGSDGSPGKSPSKKKKKFRTPSFLKKSKKKGDS